MTIDAPPRAGRREWIGLAVLGLPTMLLSLDISVLFLALPKLTEDLGATSTEQLWITDVYGFMTAGLLVTMGTLGDRIGRRRLLLAGAAAFAVASVLAAYSTTPEMLIVTRALLGIAGATLMPSTLAMISHMFRDPRQMGVAMAAWTAAFMGGVVVGPIVGGALLGAFWWGSVFLIGVPVMLLLLITGPRLLPESRDEAAGRIDLASVVLSLAAILPVIYGLKAVARDGWRLLPVAAVAAGVAVGWVFVRRQQRLDQPLLDLKLFANRSFRAAVLIGFLVAVLQGGVGLMVNLFLQVVEGLSPLAAGLWQVPAALVLLVAIMLTPALSRRVRPGYVLAGGMAVSMVGQLLLAAVGVAGGLGVLIVGLSIVYFGVGPVGALVNQIAMSSVPPERGGSAGALVGTGGEFGVALGIAVLGSIGTAVYSGRVAVPAGVPESAAGPAGDSVTGAGAVAGDLPAPVATALLDSAQDAFTAGLVVVSVVCAVAFAALAVLAAGVLRHERPIGEEAPERVDEQVAEPVLS